MLDPVRRALERAGYLLWRRDFIPYGVSACLDVRRLSVAQGRPVRRVFDVGAHDGEFRREALVDFPDAEFHSFEPHPVVFERLRTMCGDGAGLHRLALSDRPGTATLYDYTESGCGSTMSSLVSNAGFAVHRGEVQRRTFEVDCATIDGFCKQHQVEWIDLLKIDVEGHDLAVMRGAERMLREGRIGFVYAEFNDLFERPGVTGGALLPMAEFLGPLGLRFVATYNEGVEAAPMWISANVLFARP